MNKTELLNILKAFNIGGRVIDLTKFIVPDDKSEVSLAFPSAPPKEFAMALKSLDFIFFFKAKVWAWKGQGDADNKKGRSLAMADVVLAIQEHDEEFGTEFHASLKIVGKWLWLEMGEGADDGTLNKLGFKFNANRNCWQHPCGNGRTRFAKGFDPKSRYGAKEIEIAVES